MIRVYDLSIQEEVVEQLINDPSTFLISTNVSCSEAGYTTVTIQYKNSPEPIHRKRHRKIERFILFDGMNQQLDEILNDSNIKLRNKNEFFTENGVIIVLDYEFLTPEGE